MANGPNLARRLSSEDRYGALVGGETAFHVQRRPVSVVFGLCDAVGVFARVANNTAVKDARYGGAGVHQNQPHGAANGGVGPISGAEQIVARVDV